MLFQGVYCLFEQCDHSIILRPGNSVYINSPYYPNRYPSGSSCRYTVQTQADHYVQFDCNIQLDKIQSQCTTENFYFNNAGSYSIPGSDFYCGEGLMSKRSLQNVAVISYVSTVSSGTAGRFSCIAKSQPQTSSNECDCGWSVTRKVVGGQETTINEFPSMAGVFDNREMRIFCGATIIHNRYLISAAHCFTQRSLTTGYSVIVGDHDFTITTDTPYTKIYNIQSIMLHENFESNTKRNDIALLLTTTPMEWNNGVGPACLPFNYNSPSFTGTQVDVPGWGTMSFGGIQTSRLRKVTLDIMRNGECEKRISNLASSQLCTFTPGRDTCQYDSGGGVFFRQYRMYVVGVTSYGFGCASTLPSVSTRVSSYLPWIQRNTPGATYCNK